MKSEKKKEVTHLKFRSVLVNELIGNFCSKKKPGYSPGRALARKRNYPDGKKNCQKLSNAADHMPSTIKTYRSALDVAPKQQKGPVI
jgi:hypothetical protein